MYFSQIINYRMILNNVGKIVEEEWLKTGQIRKGVEMHEYMIMPNHIHGIIDIQINYEEYKKMGIVPLYKFEEKRNVVGLV